MLRVRRRSHAANSHSIWINFWGARQHWRVVVARANNNSVFFTLPNGRRKAPDVIAVSGNLILVVEAKQIGEHLSKPTATRYSDIQCMEFLAASEDAQTELTAKVQARLSATHILEHPAYYAAVLFGGASSIAELPADVHCIAREGTPPVGFKSSTLTFFE
jgi:hypothetical protein